MKPEDNTDSVGTAPELGAKDPASAKSIPITSSEPDSEPEPAHPSNIPPEPAQEESAPPEKKDFQPPKQKGSKKKLVVTLVVILLAAAIGTAAYMYLGKDKTTEQPTTASTSQSSTSAPTNNYVPQTVAYAYKDTDSNPYILYNRPVAGGERTAAELKLAIGDNVYPYDVNGSNVVFGTAKGLYLSTDSGKTYKSITTISDKQLISSVKFAGDGKTIAYGHLDASNGNKTVVKTVGLDGTAGKDLLTSTKAVYIAGYDGKQKIVYTEGCMNCDGLPEMPILYDAQANKKTILIDKSKTKESEVMDLAVNSDLSTLVYAKGTENASNQGLGVAATAPFTIYTINLADNKTTTAATFGTKNEKSTNGTLRTREVHVGFVAGSSTPYYTDDANLYVVKSGKPSLTFTATKPILYVPFVGEKNVIAGAGAQTADYTLVNYDITTKKSVNIFSGDNNTVIFGVTTK